MEGAGVGLLAEALEVVDAEVVEQVAVVDLYLAQVALGWNDLSTSERKEAKEESLMTLERYLATGLLSLLARSLALTLPVTGSSAGSPEACRTIPSLIFLFISSL